MTTPHSQNLIIVSLEIETRGFPILDWNGKIVYGNDAIVRMLAKLYGLTGNGIFEEAQVDSVFVLIRDLLGVIIHYLQSMFGFTEIDQVSSILPFFIL